MKKVIVITGPTAIGKTKISIEIAKKLNTDIINGDCYQLYKGLDILTAKPTNDELREVKHHLISEIDSTINFSIYNYQKMVRELIDKIDIPLIVGGSGLYIDTVIYNYQFSDVSYEFDDSLYTNEELKEMLIKKDQELALMIPTNNRRRLIRALKIVETTNVQDRNKKDELVYQPLIIQLNTDRDMLYKRINQRVLKMIDVGLIEEVQKEKDLSNNNLGKAIGYLDTLDYLNNKISKDELINNIQIKSRHYAKRQLTWFRNHPHVKEVMIDLNDSNYIEKTIQDILDMINDFLQQ